MKSKVLDSAGKMIKSLVADGWSNIYTGRGVTGKDKQLSTTYGSVKLLNEQTLRDLYRGDGFARRIINLPTGEMVREWFEVAGDTDGEVVKYLSTIEAKKHVLQALRFARAFGGSVIVMGIDDGNELDMPLNESNMRTVEFLRVYDRWRVSWTTGDIYDEPENPKYGIPEKYQISPIVSGEATPFYVHETRILKFDGEEVDDRTRQENDGWGDSYFQATWNELANLSDSYNSCKEIIDDFIQIILKVKNLQEMIAAGQEDIVKKRLEIIDLGRHVRNTIMLDGEEEYSKEASTTSGLEKLLQEFQKAVSAVNGIPMTLLMGQSPGGLNATGDSDIRQWYDNIAKEQEKDLLPNLSRLVKIAMLCKEGPTKGKEIEDWSIDFNPLWQPSEKEVVETRHKQAEADKIYIDTGVLYPSEVSMSRFGGDEYSIDTHIEEGLHDVSAEVREPEEEIEKEEEEIEEFEEDAFEKVKKKGKSSHKNHHTHPYTVDDNGNGKLESGTFPLWEGSKEKYTITHTHEVIAYNVQSGGLDNHTHELEYDLNE